MPISPKIQDLIDRRREYVRLVLRHEPKPAEFFASDMPESYVDPQYLSKTWRGFSQSLKGTKGRRPVFHDLRHSFISYALSREAMKVEDVAKVVGHSDPSVTYRIYTDSFPNDRKEGMLRMDEVL